METPECNRQFILNEETIARFSGFMTEMPPDIFAEGYCADCSNNPCQCKEREDYED